MKRLASLKHSSSVSAPTSPSKRSQQPNYHKTNKKSNGVKNNPYPTLEKPDLETPIPNSGNGHLSFYTPPSGRSISVASHSQSKTSLPVSHDGQQPTTINNKSTAPTISTSRDTVSDAAHSKAGTTATVGGAVSSNGVGGGEGSTFSSPAPSVRSLTTTLTTMQSTAPSNLLAGPNNQGTHNALTVPQSNHIHQHSNSHFTHQFPSSPPASAIPPHLANHSGGGHPATYNTATANNLLTDNASIMTLASSSKRRRRNSVDTNASMRALAPSSLFGGSRESLPLSVLSSSVNDQSSISGHHQGRQVSVGLANAERASVYSSSGIAPALPSERNSYYAGKQNNPGDGGSMRNGLVSHGRNNSITRSIGGLAGTESPIASPREVPVQGRVSRRNSGWGEVNEEDSVHDQNDQSSARRKHDDREA